ncbi:MAG: hypothetical protein H6742_01540 [Alphaproteobacteria bacterium]|nr:hypothetical protein [Alphaproteobacteria bacterium]
MMRRTLARTISSSKPATGALRPFLLAVFTTITLPNVSWACGMYIPEEMELVAQRVEVVAPDQAEAVAENLAAAFAAIDGVLPEEELVLVEETTADAEPVGQRDGKPQS